VPVRRRRAKRARRAGSHHAAEADRVRGRRAGEGSEVGVGGRGATAERGSGRAAGDGRDRGAGEEGGRLAGEGEAPREGGRDPPAGEGKNQGAGKGKEAEAATGSQGVAEGPEVKTRNLKRAEKDLKAETSQRVLRKRI